MAPEARAEVMENELLKQDKKLKAYAKGESNLLGELIQGKSHRIKENYNSFVFDITNINAIAKNRIRTLESQIAKLSSDYHALSSTLRQEVMVSVAQSFDRAVQRSRMNVNVNKASGEEQEAQEQHQHYK